MSLWQVHDNKESIMTKKEKEITRHYRLVHQIVSLTGINFQTKSIIGEYNFIFHLIEEYSIILSTKSKVSIFVSSSFCFRAFKAFVKLYLFWPIFRGNQLGLNNHGLPWHVSQAAIIW